MSKPTEAMPLADDPAALEKHLDKLFHKANKPEPALADVEQMRAFMRKHKDLKLWQRYTAPDEAAINFLLQQNIAGGAVSEVWRFRAGDLAKELGEEAASPVELLLIRHVVLCWLQMNFIALKYSSSLGRDGVTLAQGAFWDKRMTLAQKRFTRATDALTRTRAMLAAAAYADERRAEMAGRTPARTTLRAVNS